MEERRDPQLQPLPPSLPQQSPAYPPVPQPYVQPLVQPYAAPASRPNVFIRIVRLLLRRLLYGFVLVSRKLRPHLLSVTVVTVLLAIIGVQAFLLLAPRLGNAGPADTRAPMLEPADSVKTFIQGQREFDADKMWEAFSPRFQAALLDRGASKETLQVQVENERMSGQKYVKYDYVGGVDLGDGRQMFFYVVNIESPRADRNGPISYIFTTDKDGKIVRVE